MPSIIFEHEISREATISPNSTIELQYRILDEPDDAAARA